MNVSSDSPTPMVSRCYPAAVWYRCERAPSCGTFAAPAGADHCPNCRFIAIPVTTTASQTQEQ